MRCLALAHALKSQCWRIHFVCRELPGHYCDVIQAAGFPLSRLPLAGVNTEPDWVEDAEQTMAAIHAFVEDGVEWLVVDHYMLGDPWERVMRPHVAQVLVIDDLGNRRHDCDVLLDQNVVSDMPNRYVSLKPQGCTQLIGPSYALLQPIYEKARQEVRPRKGAVKRILIFFGGVDGANMTERAIDAVLQLQRPDIAVDVVLGANYVHQEAMQHKVLNHPHIHIHTGLPHLASLMKIADLAIGAGGVTHWERMCLGLPSLVISLSDNQIANNESLDKLGLVKLLGHHSTVTVSQLVQVLSEVIRVGIPSEWSQRCMGVVDGRGALRVWAAMELHANAPLVVRNVSLSDERLLLEWANDPLTRQNAFSTAPIPNSVHANWLRKKLNDPSSTRFYIVQTQDGVLLGQVRFDVQEGVWEIDYAVNPSLRGLGVGRPMLMAALHRLRLEVPAVVGRAQVKAENQASQRVFESLGFEKTELEDGSMEFKILGVGM